jgi:copper chaperone CopZ
VRGALKKISGVESVDVSLNKGLATIKLGPGNTVRLDQIWDTIKNNGFTTKETRVVARGEVSERNEKLRFKLTGTEQEFDLIPEPKSAQLLERLKKQAGRSAIIEGRIAAGAIEVQDVREHSGKGK